MRTTGIICWLWKFALNESVYFLLGKRIYISTLYTLNGIDNKAEERHRLIDTKRGKEE